MNSLPPQIPTFTAEQRRILGQVYNLILSWRTEKKKAESSASRTTENNVVETIKSESFQVGGSNG